jgi:hypothetical protein
VLQLPETPPPASQEPVTDASRTFTIFHGWVRTIPVHARFNRAEILFIRSVRLLVYGGLYLASPFFVLKWYHGYF